MALSRINASAQNTITYTKRNISEQKSKNSSSKTDALTLTEEAQQFLKTQRESENAKKSSNSEYKTDFERFIEMLNQEEENSSESSLMDTAKCMKIARRIQNGDKVPLKDIKFLAKKDPKLYMMAMTFKRNDNPKPKKYKSILDKNDTNSTDTQTLSQTEGIDSEISADALAEGLGEGLGEE